MRDSCRKPFEARQKRLESSKGRGAIPCRLRREAVSSIRTRSVKVMIPQFSSFQVDVHLFHAIPHAFLHQIHLKSTSNLPKNGQFVG